MCFRSISLLKLGFFACVALLMNVFPTVSLAQPDYPQAIWNQAYPGHWYTSGNGKSFCVIHDMEGYYESVISYFQASNTQASIHYCVNSLQNGNDPAHGYVEGNPQDAPAGEITQMVREQYYAWHVRCWNTYMFGTEHEGFVDSPAWYSEAMYQASAALQHSLCVRYGIPMDRNHIVGHNEWQTASWTNWMAANWPQIDYTCNNHTDPGQYWDWNHFMLLVNSNVTNLPATVASQLFNKSADQGSVVNYSISANGTSPINFRWLLNGLPISGATSSNYTIPNLQLSNAGNYSVMVSNLYGSATSSVSILTVNPTQTWVTVFYDTLQNDTSTNWVLFQASGNAISDFTTNWGFDFTSSTYTFNSATNIIPVAPGTTNGVKRALKITVNKNDAVAATSGVSLYPAGKSYGGNYALKFDMWINYTGGQGGGTGSTEYATFGLNHSATRINWASGTASSSDGVWFAVDGEGGAASTDYMAFAGNPSGNPTSLGLVAGGFQANGALTTDNSDRLYVGIFPGGTYETPGAPGKHWVQGEVDQINGVIIWKLNGVVVAERTNTSSFTNGDIMMGYMDTFSSIGSPLQDGYVLFANVRVLQAATRPVFTMQPLSMSVPIASNVTFTSAAAGYPSPDYYWNFGGTNISASNSPSFAVTNARTKNSGTYTVLASNLAGSVLSSNATLSVTIPQPVISNIWHVTNGVLNLQFSGQPGCIYELDSSSNLVNWVVVTNLTSGSGIFQYGSTNAGNGSKFYRLRWISD
jgi:N-acetyl-anhydromuramyl-L-alanine amidase AmpD